MVRKTFFSFHFKDDNWRAAKIRNIGKIEGNEPVSDNDWEEVKNKGDSSIKNWIDGQLEGKSCTIILVGEKTADRKWIKYEIKKSVELGKGILGINIHNIKDNSGNQSNKGRNPFEDFTVDGKNLSSLVKVYNPPYKSSTDVYNYIRDNIEEWVEHAINNKI